MAIPGFEKIMLPLLEIARDGKEHRIADAREELARHFNLTEDERRELQPAGWTRLFDNRVRWARQFLVWAGLLVPVSWGFFRITPRGTEVLSKNPDAIDEAFLLQFQEFQDLKKKGTREPVLEGPAIDEAFVFPLEKFLEEFLVANWDKTALGKSLSLYTEDGEATQYPAGDAGEIDILARDRKTHDWVVIELKKGRSSDAVVGQVLRYMGWVKKHKAANGENVRGIIVTSTPDDKIKYALLAAQGIAFYTYRVSFDLTEEKQV